jgi:uncharacterized protein YjiS (DUF1127 family)
MIDILDIRLTKVPATLQGIVAAWRERARFRWELEQMLRDNPHLVDDAGLTRRQAEAEIAKPFWQPYGELGNDIGSSVPARLGGSPSRAIAAIFTTLVQGPLDGQARHTRGRI